MFDKYSDYYDFFYEDKDYQKESAYILNLLNKNHIFEGNILEFGSGTGKHGYLLAEKGFKIHGIELSSEMVAKHKKHPNFTCQQGDITKVKLEKTYDAIISLFHVMSYQTTNSQIKSVFENASKHLPTNGLFIFDIWYSPAVNYQQPSVRVKRFENEEINIIRFAEPDYHANENLVDVKYTFIIKNLKNKLSDQFNETHTMRHFSIPEIDILAELYNFKRIHAEEFLTKKIPSKNTWGVCLTLQKK
tara:strand:- start:6125 stop:6862 length:738 start_codon:yes stop_codon:yes gene_type:complete